MLLVSDTMATDSNKGHQIKTYKMLTLCYSYLTPQLAIVTNVIKFQRIKC